MERDRISQTQLCALLWAGLMAPAAELLPAVTLPIAGRGAWLSAMAALPVLLLLGWGLGGLGLRHGGLAGAIRWGLGSVVGRLVLLLYFIWGELLLALRLRLCAQRLIASGERDGSLWFFLPAAALLVLWMARGKLPAFARAGQAFLAVLLTAAGAVLLLSLPQVRGDKGGARELVYALRIGIPDEHAHIALLAPVGRLPGGLLEGNRQAGQPDCRRHRIILSCVKAQFV